MDFYSLGIFRHFKKLLSPLADFSFSINALTERIKGLDLFAYCDFTELD